jgi:hypothetical protein
MRVTLIATLFLVVACGSEADSSPPNVQVVSADWRQVEAQPVTTLGPSYNARAHAVLRNRGRSARVRRGGIR